MKIRISEFINMWNAIDKIYGINDHFPPQFEASMANNFKVFAPLIQQIKGRESELKDKEIDIPLSQITIDSLPDKLPPGTTNALKPLLIDFEETEFNSNLDDLIENGQEKEKSTAKDSD